MCRDPLARPARYGTTSHVTLMHADAVVVTREPAQAGGGALAGSLTVLVPVRLMSPNRIGSEHYRSRHHRRVAERRATSQALDGKRPPPGPWAVSICRVGVRAWDSDNLAFAGKCVRDACADFLGVDDGDEAAASWHYAQRIERRQEREPRTGKLRFASWVELTIATRGAP